VGGTNIVTVGEIEDFAKRGGIINFYDGCWGMCWNPNTQTGDSMSANNGNLKVQQTEVPNDDNLGYEGRRSEFTQSFEYDSLNRIQFTSQGNWRQWYSYDQYGNRTINTDPNLTYGGVNNLGSEVQTATNRLYAPGDLALPDASRRMQYDDAGNLKRDTYTGQGSRTYDGENRMITAQGGIGSTLQYYSYDGDGRRVKRIVENAETWQVYGIGGELIAEYAANTAASSPQKEYGYRNGQMLITATAASAGWGPAPSYSGPNPLTTGNDIKLENLTELRTAVNSLRAHAGLSAYSFTVDPSPERGVTTVKADHIRQLRTALEQARSQLGLSMGGYEHATLTENVSSIYAKDFQELRDQIASAWNSGSDVDIRWLVGDQLGTPRMIFDQSGTLATTTRHDYLPFGEEIFAGTGGRTTGQGYEAAGYASVDGARQKFTKKERDIETGLDYFLARYYSSTQGRFTSPDEFTGGPDELYTFAEDASENPSIYANLRNPQSLNKYQYAYNNPLRYVDPDGHDPDGEPDPQNPTCPCTMTPAQSDSMKKDLQKGVDWIAGITGMTATADAIRRAASDSATQVKIDIVITVVVVKSLKDLLTGTRPVPQPITATPPSQQRQPLPPPPPSNMSKGGRQNKRDSGLANKTDKQVSDGARNKSLDPSDRRKYQTEEKQRKQRNKQKRHSQ